jgi:hypothetical protein
MSDNGKWQAGFWLITVISGVWLVGLSTGVVANEIRNTENHRLMVQERTAQFSQLIRENSNSHTKIMERLARIEALLK